jgi:hypothetical protein
MFEVFDPYDGTPLFRFRFRLLARATSWLLGLDWNEAGGGW